MKKQVLFILWMFSVVFCAAQKRPLTLEAIDEWPDIRGEKISANGRVVMYRVFRSFENDTLVVQSVDKGWKAKFTGVSVPRFTANSRWLLYKKRDSLLVYDLVKFRKASALAGINSYKIPESGNGQWLAYHTSFKKLVLFNLGNHKTVSYDSVLQYQFSDNGKVLVFQTTGALQWVDIASLKLFTVMRGALRLKNFVFDDNAEQLAFLAEVQAGAHLFTTLRYYRQGMDSAVVKVDKNTSAPDSSLRVPAAGFRFSPDGRRLFLVLKRALEKRSKSPAGAADVNVWHYDDEYLQTEQVSKIGFDSTRTFTAVLHINENKLIHVDRELDERYVDIAGDYALVRQNSNIFTSRQKGEANPVFFVVNINDGQRTRLVSQRNLTIQISSTGRYIVWYDPVKQTYFSYATETGVQKEITPTLAGTLTANPNMRLRPFLPYGIAGWLPNDEALLVYDEFDIWKIDPTGVKPPVTITNGYGRKHQLMLRIWHRDNNDYSAPVIKDDAVWLVAFDTETKKNGFFRASISHSSNPIRLTLDSCLYYAHYRFNLPFLAKYNITKAAQAGAYMVRRMSSSEYPNLYFTKDFKNFVPLSDVHPHRDYNWLTSELINWQHADGTRAQGVLYKPENFDPQKKYPVIFYFYEKLSHRLHQFMHPELSSGSIDIPWYVSNGYLVVTPDISYTAGNPGESALNAVSACARSLIQMPWVDSMRMGLQGHSFGGYQVNYLVSHTNLFAAAQESAGASDFISYYNGFYREHSAQFYFEHGQGRLGYTLWEKPELYINNSPVFKANEVQTPLLIMHNERDGEVPFQQGIEWFTALRRLGKKVWMLQYDREHHSIDQRKNKRDFTIRVGQFFDHYLKGAPAPKWMVSGVPARLKGKETGMELTGDAGTRSY